MLNSKKGLNIIKAVKAHLKQGVNYIEYKGFTVFLYEEYEQVEPGELPTDISLEELDRDNLIERTLEGKVIKCKYKKV
ncbi:hypothetical protein [Peribacillus butanolivorans]|uniref:hypothetical protein n=1 Tax=Peribacillus butanolivorans TaxID=421767 RepID=UPI0035E304B8